jgi:hypothetical protein
MTLLSPLLAPGADIDANPAYRRADARNNMFVTAVLYGERGAIPVRIRNMSRSGALIESAAFPPEGSPVRLCRGSFSVGGQIVWHRDNRAGMRFDAVVDVADWLPSGNKANGQQHVDEMIYAIRSASSQGKGSSAVTPPPAKPDAIAQLLALQEALATAASDLAGDAHVAIAHPAALQAIDLAARKLEELAALLAGPG